MNTPDAVASYEYSFVFNALRLSEFMVFDSFRVNVMDMAKSLNKPLVE